MHVSRHFANMAKTSESLALHETAGHVLGMLRAFCAAGRKVWDGTEIGTSGTTSACGQMIVQQVLCEGDCFSRSSVKKYLLHLLGMLRAFWAAGRRVWGGAGIGISGTTSACRPKIIQQVPYEGSCSLSSSVDTYLLLSLGVLRAL